MYQANHNSGDKMTTTKINIFDFAGSIQRNIAEYLEAAITWHFDDFTRNGGKISEINNLDQDVMNIVDNAFGSEFDNVEMPDGSTYTRADIEEAVRESIDEIYNTEKKRGR